MSLSIDRCVLSPLQEKKWESAEACYLAVVAASGVHDNANHSYPKFDVCCESVGDFPRHMSSDWQERGERFWNVVFSMRCSAKSNRSSPAIWRGRTMIARVVYPLIRERHHLVPAWVSRMIVIFAPFSLAGFRISSSSSGLIMPSLNSRKSAG